MVQGGQAVVDPMFERKEWNDSFTLKIHCYKILKLKSLMNCYNELDLKKICFCMANGPLEFCVQA